MYVDPNKKSHLSDDKQPFYRYYPSKQQFYESTQKYIL